ncbi:MAG: hypothetical protein NZ518_02735, partial [Dehalococcoidia bacterium]|nr:hypothetical protein [Dehalococcoidia bacterium]
MRGMDVRRIALAVKGSKDAPPLAALGVVIALWGLEVLLGRQPVWGATLLQFAAWWEGARQAILAGHLPLWSPLLGFGSPLWANPQAAVASPFALLTAPLGATRAVGWSLLIHAFIAAVGTFVAGRRLGVAPWPAAFGGIVFALSGAFAGRAVFPPLYATASWIGVVVASWPEHRRWTAGVWPGVALALAWL